jgi:uncharacterized protein YndB with AHSA1/START domain
LAGFEVFCADIPTDKMPMTRREHTARSFVFFIISKFNAKDALFRMNAVKLWQRTEFIYNKCITLAMGVQTIMGGNTVKLHRVFTAKPERVFKAFTDADAMAKWLPPNGFTGKVHEMDARVGGRYRMSFTNFTNGKSHAFGGEFLEMVENEKLRYTDKFEDPNMPGEMETTIVIKAVSVGTELNVEQTGIPEMIPAEACYLGWQESLNLLKLLVEAEIPDEMSQ